MSKIINFAKRIYTNIKLRFQKNRKNILPTTIATVNLQVQSAHVVTENDDDDDDDDDDNDRNAVLLTEKMLEIVNPNKIVTASLLIPSNNEYEELKETNEELKEMIVHLKKCINSLEKENKINKTKIKNLNIKIKNLEPFEEKIKNKLETISNNLTTNKFKLIYNTDFNTLRFCLYFGKLDEAEEIVKSCPKLLGKKALKRLLDDVRTAYRKLKKPGYDFKHKHPENPNCEKNYINSIIWLKIKYLNYEKINNIVI